MNISCLRIHSCFVQFRALSLLLQRSTASHLPRVIRIMAARGRSRSPRAWDDTRAWDVDPDGPQRMAGAQVDQALNFVSEMYLSGSWRAQHICELSWYLKDVVPAFEAIAVDPSQRGGNCARTQRGRIYCFCYGREGPKGAPT